MDNVVLRFELGTVTAENLSPEVAKELVDLQWDPRSSNYRAPAVAYRNIVLRLRALGVAYTDSAKAFAPYPLQTRAFTPRAYQNEALECWKKNGQRGVVVLPTGAGKTVLAVMAMAAAGRPTLIHVPTIDLMHQWFAVLKDFFGTEPGLLGGGYNEIKPLTVATYDSALIHVASKGNLFGLLVFDECHHLPGAQSQYVALSSLAPFRLGLTATPDRSDGGHSKFETLCGDVVYEAEIRELTGNTLAPYEVVTMEVELEPQERADYEKARKTYLDFIRAENISFERSDGWKNFLWKAARSPQGREAFRAYLYQKKLSQACAGKEMLIWDILSHHPGDRILIFTQDNETAYRIGRKFFLPVLTHHTRVKEREDFLTQFRSGNYRVLVTSKVLNEGVDVPDANVAIVVSGSGAVREHVQRLGRILRSKPGKRATLYELVTAGSGEYFVNKRRRQHSAYTESAAR